MENRLEDWGEHRLAVEGGVAAPPDLMTYDEVAALLGVPKGTLYAWVHDRRLPHIRLGPRLVRFSRKALAAWLAERAVAPRG